MKANHLRETKWKLGTWISSGSSVITEIAGETGFDWLLFDLEHGCTTESDLIPQFQALRASPTAAIVRVRAHHPDLMSRVLDWGADGIMVPHVSTVVEAEACVRAMRYPPRGLRGVARGVRAYGYGLRPLKEDALPKPIFFAQIETIEAVENVEGIAAIDGVDVLFVGPADLQFDLKARSEKATREYRACLEHVVAVSRAAGKPCGILIRDPVAVQAHREMGFTHVAVESDLAILLRSYQEIVAKYPK